MSSWIIDPAPSIHASALGAPTLREQAGSSSGSTIDSTAHRAVTDSFASELSSQFAAELVGVAGEAPSSGSGGQAAAPSGPNGVEWSPALNLAEWLDVAANGSYLPNASGPGLSFGGAARQPVSAEDLAKGLAAAQARASAADVTQDQLASAQSDLATGLAAGTYDFTVNYLVNPAEQAYSQADMALSGGKPYTTDQISYINRTGGATVENLTRLKSDPAFAALGAAAPAGQSLGTLAPTPYGSPATTTSSRFRTTTQVGQVAHKPAVPAAAHAKARTAAGSAVRKPGASLRVAQTQHGVGKAHGRHPVPTNPAPAATRSRQ
jgi:hypothetical protein